MKKYLIAIIASIFVLQSFAQTFDKNYSDGLLYVSTKISALKPVISNNPRNISAEALPFLSKLKEKYGITQVMRPFAQADDDALLPYILKIQFSQFGKTAELMRDLEALQEVNYCEKVPLMKVDVVPNEGMLTHLTQINAANAWNVYSGFSNITVAIVDNAVMWTHADLAQNTFTNTAEIAGNNIDDDNNGYIDDRNGWDCSNWDNNAVPTNTAMLHGTHCAGIAAACTNNSIGIASIGWGIRMIPVKTEFDNGSTSSISNGYDGIIYAAKIRARVISCSWGGSGFATTEQAVINYAWNRGCIVIASAGNSNSTTQNYPGAYANVYCVAACDPSNVKSTYSNYGTWVDITAPGNSIQSTVPYTGSVAAYQQLSGTSMATPLVAGLAGLMLSLSPNMTQTNVLNCISSTAVNIYSIAANASLTTGSLMGAGRIEAYQAMLCASSFSAMPPVANFYAFPKVSCPATPVAFTDSSLYQPTSWLWVFQGGTPATSTLSSPVVTWSTPGTYSVAMTCSNVNGTSSKTKLSYITIGNAINLPFSEGFENAAFLPTNWTDKNIDNDNIFWQRRPSLGGFGTSTACAMFDNYTYNCANERDEMRSPKYNFSNVANARLRFDVAYAKYDNVFSDSLQVSVSTNCGATWTSIYLRGGAQFTTAANSTSQFVPTSTQWRRDSIDVSALTAGQPNVMFAFINRGHYGQPIYLDNINLVFPTPTVGVVYNSTVCANGTVNFTNTTTGAANYTWTSSGALPASSTGTNVSLTYSNSGVYSVSLLAQNGTTFTTTVRSVTVVAYPSPSASGASVCAGQTAVVSASNASSYLWSNASGTFAATSTAAVSPTTTSTYTLTGYNSTCGTSLAVNVSVTPLPTLTALSASICQGASTTLSVSGANSYTWSNGSNQTTITVSPSTNTVYTVSGTASNCIASRTLAVSLYSNVVISAAASPSLLCTGATANFTAGGALTYTWPGGSTGNSYSLTATTSTVITVTGNDGNCNGTKQVTISVIAPPTTSISANPSGSVCAGTTVTLTAGGATSYTWANTSNTTSTLLQALTTNTVISVTGSNAACAVTNSIAITVQALPQLSISVSSASICPGGSSSLTASGAPSYSWSTGGFNGSISVTPSVSTVYTLTGILNTCSNTATSAITVFSNVIISAAVSPTIICTGATANYSAAGALTYTWSGNTLGATYTLAPTTSTVISVQGFDGNCYGNTQVSVTVISPPSITLSANPSGTLCAGKSVTVSASGAGTYTWSGSSSSLTSISQSVNTTTVFTVSGSNAACASSASITVPVQALPQLVLSTNSGTICSGDTYTVTVSGASTYSWSNGSIASTASLSSTTNTVYSVTGYSNACFSVANFSLVTLQLPQSSLTTTNINCNGECTGAYSMTTLGNGPFSYTVGATCNAPTCNSLCAGNYTALVSDNSGCSEIKTFTITQPSAISATITAVNPTCGSCNNGSMTSVVSGGSPGYSYTWSPAAGNGPAAAFLTNGCYTLTVRDVRNCIFQTSKCIENTTGIEELGAEQIRLYPNPNHGQLIVESDREMQLAVHTQLGQLVLVGKIEAGVNHIELSTLAKGVYMICLSTNEQRVYKKLLLE